jgi:ribose-phosphate pyrophosphokinase
MSILIAAFPETSGIGKKVASMLKAEYSSIDARSFPDSEFHLKLKKDPRKKIVVIISSMAKDPDTKLIETILAGGIARDYGAKKVILVATYMPYMRQDSHFLKYDSFSSKYIIKLLDNFDHIIVLDPHLHRIKKMKELSGKAENISANSLVAGFIKKRFGKNFEIVGPDEESEQWSDRVAKILKKKVVILKKERLGDKKVRIKAQKLEKNIIIIDDIISTGRTLAAAIKIAKKQGAKKIVCIGVHGLLVAGAEKLITPGAELITTNSVANKYARIDISPVIADALKKYK